MAQPDPTKCTDICICNCICICTHTYVYVCLYVNAFVYVYVYVCRICIIKSEHTHICIYKYMYRWELSFGWFWCGACSHSQVFRSESSCCKECPRTTYSRHDQMLSLWNLHFDLFSYDHPVWLPPSITKHLAGDNNLELMLTYGRIIFRPYGISLKRYDMSVCLFACLSVPYVYTYV